MSLNPKDFFYQLPDSLIANQPSSHRDHCRLLSLNRKNGQIDHHYFFDLENLLTSNDVLVLNQSKVFPARLFGQKNTGGKFEVLLFHQVSATNWQAISKPRLLLGQQLIFGHHLIGQVVQSNKSTGQIEIKFNQSHNKFWVSLDKIGHTPIPPYIHNSDSEKQIRQEYQTVYATKIGSAAAPTAGLHFTKSLLNRLKKKGVQIEYITLHVGLGTFQSLRPENLQNHTLHSEFYEIKPSVAKKLNLAKQQGKRIIAVGTTTVRTLESAVENNQIFSGKNSTNIFISPGFKFKFVDALITNFHLPESSLLMLVSAFATRQQILSAYQTAIGEKYRFFSFGDAMFIY